MLHSTLLEVSGFTFERVSVVHLKARHFYKGIVSCLQMHDTSYLNEYFKINRFDFIKYAFFKLQVYLEIDNFNKC